MLDKLKDIIIIVLSIVVLLSFIFNSGCESKQSNSTIDTFYIKATKEYHTLQTITNPKPYIVQIPGTPGATITIPAKVDSGAVARDYFTKRTYVDSLMNDSVTVYLTEEVYKNELRRIKTGYRWKVPTMVIKETKVVEKQLIFLGLEPYGNLNSFGMFASADFDTKKALFGYGYDPFNKTHKISVKAKLRLWNKKK